MITKPLVWSRYAVVCHGCNRRFRITKDALAQNRQNLIDAQGPEVSDANTDADVAMQFEFCMECSGNVVETGEFISDNPFARRWDPKGWALDTLAKATREAVSLLTTIGENRDEVKVKTLTVRAQRRAFVAEALRHRIDGRF